MNNKNDTGKFFNLGDQEFQNKLSNYYSWFAPVLLLLFACGIFLDKAYITGFIILLLSIFLLPILKKYIFKIPKLIRLLVELTLIILAFQSMNLYI